MLVSLLLSGAMRWDIRRPWRPFGDRFVLAAGHTVPARLRHAGRAQRGAARPRTSATRDARFVLPDDGRWALTWEDLLKLRRRGGLPGHAEMEGKTLFLKFNTGPVRPWHAAGRRRGGGAQAGRRRGGQGLRGRGRGRPDARRHPRDAQLGLGPRPVNLVFLVDWNDFGIDDPPISWSCTARPRSGSRRYGWRVTGTREGSEWAPVTRAVLEAARGDNPDGVPSMAWFKTRKGRGYGKYDNKSHGTPHAMNSPEFWAVRKRVHGQVRRGRTPGVDEPAPTDAAERDAQARAQLRGRHERAARDDRASCDRDQPTGWSRSPARCRSGSRASTLADTAPRSSTTRASPTSRPTRRRCGSKPGEKAPNRAALAAWGAWVNATATRRVRPAAVHRLLGGPRRVDQHRRLRQGLGGPARLGLVQPRHEPARRAPAAADHRVHQRGHQRGHRHRQPGRRPDERRSTASGRACSTYGSFCYLKYGPMRLFSQLAQDCELQGRQGDLGGRPLGARDGRGLAHALRHLRDRRHPALPGGPRHRPASVGVQRGAGGARRGAARPMRTSSRCT